MAIQPGNSPILAVVAGSGLIARCAVDAGADLILALSAGLYRNVGVGTLASFLPFGNANQQTEILLREHILPQRLDCPTYAGIFAAADDSEVEQCLSRWRDWGVEGIVNWPAIGFVDGALRKEMERLGIGTLREAQVLRQAKLAGFSTMAFALSCEETSVFLDAGVDGLILNLGLTQETDDIHEKRDRMQQAIARLNEMIQVVEQSPEKPICLAFGGPVTTSDDLTALFRHSRAQGFAGGSVFERLPVETAVTSTIRRFRQSMHEVDHGRESRGLGLMIGRSPAMRELFDLIQRVAPLNVNALIQGETGTGKELVATQIHRLSPRAHESLVTLNCGAIPDSLLESELFGHEKGAFTSANRRRRGKFELADRGTLFLDEVADLTPRGQVALLRAIQQREITPVGGDTSIPIDVRIIAASNRPLDEAVRTGQFREDLYYRLNQLTLRVPPLRDRGDDLELLAREFLSRVAKELNHPSLDLGSGLLNKLKSHHWPGNIRELESILREAAIREDGSVIAGKYFQHSATNSSLRIPGNRTGEADRRTLAEAAIHANHGNKSLAARSLGISRKTLYVWLQSSDERSDCRKRD